MSADTERDNNPWWFANDVFPWKRAVYQRAPLRFAIEPLIPTKQGGNFCYGLRIIPIPASSSDGQGGKEYEIWRRWEDCLWFQKTLETRYCELLRKQSPEDGGLAPLNVHDLLPLLNKKGNFLRPSPVTIIERSAQFHALIRALFAPDVPSILQRLRRDRAVHDFFGFWDRDYAQSRKPNSIQPFAIPRPSASEEPRVMHRPALHCSTSSPNLRLSRDAPPRRKPLPSIPPLVQLTERHPWAASAAEESRTAIMDNGDQCSVVHSLGHDSSLTAASGSSVILGVWPRPLQRAYTQPPTPSTAPEEDLLGLALADLGNSFWTGGGLTTDPFSPLSPLSPATTLLTPVEKGGPPSHPASSGARGAPAAPRLTTGVASSRRRPLPTPPEVLPEWTPAAPAVIHEERCYTSDRKLAV